MLFVLLYFTRLQRPFGSFWLASFFNPRTLDYMVETGLFADVKVLAILEALAENNCLGSSHRNEELDRLNILKLYCNFGNAHAFYDQGKLG